MKAMSLPELSDRQIRVITGFTNERLAAKMISMGIYPGRKVELVRKASFGDTYYIRVDKRALAIRKKEAACILLK